MERHLIPLLPLIAIKILMQENPYIKIITGIHPVFPVSSIPEPPTNALQRLL